MNDGGTGAKTGDPTTRLATLVFLVGLGYLLFATFRPFLSALVWSAVLSYGLYPLFTWLVQTTGNRRVLSAAAMSIAVTVGFILPLAYLSFLIGKELAATYLTVVTALQQGSGRLEQWLGHPLVSGWIGQIQEFQRMTGTDLRSVLVSNLAQLGSALVEELTHVAKNVLAGLTELGIIVLSTFFLFRDGESVVEWIRELLPLADAQQRLVVRRFDEVVKGAVLGNTLVAALEGVVGGLAFWIAGLPAALLWGAVMAVLGYLPLVGAALVWAPVAAYLIIQGNYVSGTILCVAGFIIAFLDYVVRTVVVGSASKLHTLSTFFAVLGGIQFFGLVGIVAGPLVVAVSFALLDSYRTERSRVDIATIQS